MVVCLAVGFGASAGTLGLVFGGAVWAVVETLALDCSVDFASTGVGDGLVVLAVDGCCCGGFVIVSGVGAFDGEGTGLLSAASFCLLPLLEFFEGEAFTVSVTVQTMDSIVYQNCASTWRAGM